MRLGTNGDGEDVVVKREVGSTQGYGDRLQAIAVARLSGAEPAAVVQGYDGKWHALETTAIFYEMPFTAADTPTRAVYGLPSSKGIADLRKKMDLLKAKLAELDARKTTSEAAHRARRPRPARMRIRRSTPRQPKYTSVNVNQPSSANRANAPD